MPEKLTIKHSYIDKDAKIIRETLVPWDNLDGFLQASFNLGAQKIEITYLLTKSVYEIEK
jgi:hypothetical protein